MSLDNVTYRDTNMELDTKDTNIVNIVDHKRKMPAMANEFNNKHIDQLRRMEVYKKLVAKHVDYDEPA